MQTYLDLVISDKNIINNQFEKKSSKILWKIDNLLKPFCPSFEKFLRAPIYGKMRHYRLFK